MTRTWVIPVLALVVALGVPGIAQAQVTCPVPATFTEDGFDIVSIVEAGLASGLLHDATLGIWPGAEAGYADFDDMADYFDDIPLYAWHQLVQAIISDEDYNMIQGQSELVHDIVCQGFVANAALLPADLICNSLVNFFENGTQGGASKATWAAVLLLDDIADAEDAIAVAYGEDGLPLCAGVPDPTTLTILGGTGELLGDDGDVDGDAETNLDEWQSAVTNNPADFDAAVTEFIASALAGTATTVTVSGPSQLFTGFGGTYTAITIDPTDPMFTETYTFSSSNPAILRVDDAVNGEFTGLNIGTANVIATGDDSAVSGTRSVSIVAPQWFQVCSLDDDILSQAEGLTAAAGCTLSTTNVFTDINIDSFAGDGIPDINQLALAAYTLCDGGTGPAQSAALIEYNANVAMLEALLVDLASIDAWLNGDGGTRVDIAPNGGTIDITTTPAGETLQLSAVSTGVDAGETHTWMEGSGGTVVTVSATGLVTAVGVGTTTVMAEGDDSGVVDAETVRVFDLATENRVAISGGADICVDSAGIQLTAATTGADSGETVMWSEDSAGAVLTVSASGFVTPVATGTANVMATGDDSGESASVEIEVFACTGPCDQPSSKATTVNTSGQRFHNATLVPAYFATSAIAEAIGLGLGTAGGTGGSTDLTFLFGNLSATAPLLDGVNSLIGALLPLEDVVDGLAAWGGLTSEHAGYWEAVGNGTGLLPAGNELDPFVNGGASLFDIPLHSAVVGGIAGVLAFGEGAVGGDYATTAACGGGPCPGLEALTAVLVPPALADLAAFPATYTPADFDVIGSSPTKVAGIEPYDNNSVFAPGVNPQDFDNQTYSDLVAAGGGDEFDFVALAAGLSLFGAGSPFLPVGGALLIGILAGGLAALGARRLRRS